MTAAVCLSLCFASARAQLALEEECSAQRVCERQAIAGLVAHGLEGEDAPAVIYETKGPRPQLRWVLPCGDA